MGSVLYPPGWHYPLRWQTSQRRAFVIVELLFRTTLPILSTLALLASRPLPPGTTLYALSSKYRNRPVREPVSEIESMMTFDLSHRKILSSRLFSSPLLSSPNFAGFGLARLKGTYRDVEMK